jgi:hypothetical protein
MATQVTLNSGSVDSAGSLALKTNGTTTAVTIDTSQRLAVNGTDASVGGGQMVINHASNNGLVVNQTGSGTGSWLYLRNNTDSTINTLGFTNPGVRFYDVGAAAERMRIDSSGNVGIGTSSPSAKLDISGSTSAANRSLRMIPTTEADSVINLRTSTIQRIATDSVLAMGYATTPDAWYISASYGSTGAYKPLAFATSDAERMRIDTSGNTFVGRTAISGFTTETGVSFLPTQGILIGKNASTNVASCLYMNRMAAVGDGSLIEFAESGTVEGTVSVSGTTVSYNGGHLSRWAQTTTAKDDSLVKGTVLSNLDEMNVYTDSEGNPVDNEQLNKVKVSNVEGDVNVAGVFVNWTHDDAHDVDEINMAMTGDMIIRIAQGVTVARGDLLMSAGDGTAKPQGDDIIRSKTVAKVTSTHVTCTYADGSYCVPCVLMAC